MDKIKIEFSSSYMYQSQITWNKIEIRENYLDLRYKTMVKWTKFIDIKFYKGVRI